MRTGSAMLGSVLAWGALFAACSEDVLLAARDSGTDDADADADADTDVDTDTDTDADTDTGTAACTWHTAQLGLLSSVWGAGPAEVYAVGGATLTDALAFRFDGDAWQPLPDPGTLVDMGLMDVWGFAQGGIIAISDFAIALHYDGQAWTKSITSSDYLRGVWGSAPDDVWAVGGVLDTVVLRYDGGAWTKTPTGDLPTVGPLAAVWGDGPSEIVAVGNGAILGFDGQDWSQMETTPIIDSFLMIFENAWGTSIDDLFVVGQHGLTFEGVLLHYGGQAWEQPDLGPAAVGSSLRGVHGSGPDDVWVVGERDGAGVVIRFDGSAWSEVDGPFSFPLNEVWVAAPDRIFAVGESGVVWCQ